MDYSSNSARKQADLSTEWSAWFFDKTRSLRYKHRLDSSGEEEYCWEEPAPDDAPRYEGQEDEVWGLQLEPQHPTTQEYEELYTTLTPRSAGVDRLAQDLQELALGNSQVITSPKGNKVSAHIPAEPEAAPIDELGQLDARYVIIDQRDKFWSIGRVFIKVSWTEPVRGGNFQGEESKISVVWLGEKVYSEIRRFVIIGEGYGNVICSPIHSYGGQGTLKPNLPNVQQHAIVYTSRKPPEPLCQSDEQGYLIAKEQLSKTPIRVVSELRDKEGDLGFASRINYAKIYTVEKYNRVLNIGKVHPDSMESLQMNCFFERPKSQPPQGPRRKSWYSSKSKSNRNRTEDKGQSKSKDNRDRYEDQSQPSSSKHHLPVTSTRRARRRSLSFAQPSGPAELVVPDQSNQREECHGNKQDYMSRTTWSDSRQTLSTQQDRNKLNGEAVCGDTDVDSAAAEVERVTMQDSGSATGAHYKYSSPLPNVGFNMLNTKVSSHRRTSPAATANPQWNANISPHVGGRRPIVVSGRPQDSTLSSKKLGRKVEHHNTAASWTTEIEGVQALDQPTSDVEERLEGHDMRATTQSQEVESALEQSTRIHPSRTPTLSRSSSNASLNSVASVFATPSAQSSASSATIDLPYGERLEGLLLNDPGLRVLLEVAKRKISPDKFESNFRRCLLLFSEHLRIEAPTSLHPSTPRIIRKFSTHVSHSIRRTFEETPRVEKSAKQSNQHPKLAPSESQVVDDIDETEVEEEEDMEADLEGEDGEKNRQLPPLEAALVATSSFKMLRENFRVFLESDQAQRAVFDCWPAALPWPQAVEVKYFVFPGLRHFLASRFPQGCCLGNVLTFTGNRDATEAISCEAYLLREWPDIAQCLVRCLDDFLSVDQQSAIKISIDDVSIQLSPGEDTSYQTGAIMTTKASYQLQGQIARAASWLSAILRSSPHQEVCRSHVSVKATYTDTNQKQRNSKHLNKVIRITVDPLEQIKNPSTCWHSLFPHNVIAHGFPIRPRVKGVRLEISFANLAHASNCLSFIEYEDGLIAHGLKSVLIPMVELKDDDAIQWHFENKAKQESRKFATIKQILRIHAIGNWHQELDPSLLVSKRCFLGWVEKANVVIGTSDYLLETGPSRAKACPSIKHIHRYELTAGLSILSWATIQGTHVREPVSIPTSVSISQQNDLLDVINTTVDEYGIIFDNDQKIGWCLPQASIVLQIAHSTITMRGYELYDGDQIVSKNDPRFFAQKTPDGASAACAALKQSFRLKVRKHTSAPEMFVEQDFSVLIARIWHTISEIAVSLESAANKFHLAEALAPKYVLGVDLQDALNNKQSTSIRRVEVNQPWTHLTDEYPVVLFCRNLRSPIVPISIPCGPWASVPPQQNLLVAMGSSVHTFLDCRDDGLAEGLHWCASPKLIETHEGAGNVPIRHVQKLQSTKKTLANARIRATVKNCLRGAFIFGNGKENKCLSASKQFSTNTDQRKRGDNPSLGTDSMSRIYSSASAMSAEPAQELISTSPQSRDDSISDESVTDVEESVPNPSHETRCAQEQLSKAPMKEDFREMDLEPGSYNYSLRSNDGADKYERSGEFSSFSRPGKEQAHTSRQEMSSRPTLRRTKRRLDTFVYEYEN